MRIVLAVAVVFLAAYMLVLKPKGDSGTAATPTPATAEAPAAASASDANKAHTGLGKAVEAAHGAADSTEKAQNAAAGETTATTPSTTSAAPATTATTPATESTPAAKPADESLAGLPGWLQKSIDHKVVAILFTNNKAADDRRTIKALKHAYTAHGKIVTHVVPITKISKYRPVAQGVDVAQSPTLMVIDRDRHAQSLVGYANVDTINQAVIDGLLATDKPIRHVKYLKTVQRECRQVFNQAVLGENPGTSLKGYRKNVDALITTMAASLGTLRNAPVSAGYKPLSKQVNRYFASELAIGREVRSKAILSKTVDSLKVEQIVAKNDKLANRVQLELNAVGVDACN
jgi:hypothetical protein